MFTRNFYNIPFAISCVGYMSSRFQNVYGSIIGTQLNRYRAKNSGYGFISYDLRTDMFNYKSGNIAYYNQCDIVFGSDDSEETFDDYKLDFIDPTGIQYLSQYRTQVEGYEPTYNFSKTWKSNKSEPFTIREVGFVCPLGYQNWGSSDTNWGGPMLIYRKKLDEPIIVNPGDIFTLSLSLGGI